MSYALLGGAMIGIAVSLMLFLNGRVTGVSGIVSGALNPKKGDFSWRLSFVMGLLFGGVFLQILKPEVFISYAKQEWFDFIIAGLIVGFGTLLGSGCTSGHGVCGISRMSPRSILATMLFILFGVLSVGVFRFLRGEL
jgi:uncharacterized membrane protein YedE/YeeE